MVDMRYDTAGLQSAGLDHAAVAAAIEPVIAQISRLTLTDGVLGLFPTAGQFAGALDHARIGCATALARESDERTRQGQHVAVASSMAGLLTSTTAHVASSPLIVGSIVSGMGGD